MRQILTFSLFLLFSFREVYGIPGSRSFDGVKILLSNENGLEIATEGMGERGFFVGIPSEGSVWIEPIEVHGGEARIAYTGFIRDQRVAKIEVGTPVAGGRSSGSQMIGTDNRNYRFKVHFEKPPVSAFAPAGATTRVAPTATATATATVLSSPFERILSKTLLNYSEAKGWRRTRERSGGILGGNSDKSKIFVKLDGFYRVTFENLVQAGINLSGVDPQTLRLENRGEEVPIYISGEEDMSFDEEDYFEFFGESPRGEKTYFDLFTDENVYLLSWGGGLGVRIVEEDGGLTETDPNKYYEPSSFENHLHFESDLLFESLPQQTVDTTDPWFWHLLSSQGGGVTPFTLFFPSPDPSSDTPISFKMMFHGVTYDDNDPLDHHLETFLNGTLLGDTRWDGQSPHLFQGQGPPTKTLRRGDNLVQIVLPDTEATLLNWIAFDYQRLYEASNDSITFSIPENGEMGLYQFRIKGFTSSDITIYKLGISKMTNFQILPHISGRDTTYDAVFQDEVFSEDQKYVALTPSHKKAPSRITKDSPSLLRSPSNGADLLVITHEKFVGAYGNTPLQDYVAWREGQGVQVSLVTTEDIYDEFNHGILSPKAIKDFLHYAYENWNPPPLYLLLIGDGTWDYRNIRGYGGNLVPSLLQWKGSFGWVSVDNEYATVSGEDFLPDLFVGRIPVREKSELEGVLEKIMGYETNPARGEWRRNLIFAAGSGARKNISFRQVFEDSVIGETLPPSPLPIRVYADRDPYVSPDPFYGNKDILINAINEGSNFVGYFGHGGGAVWSNPYLLTLKDLPLLNNGDRLPFVASFTCFTSIFDEPSFESLGEGLLKKRDGGAIAVWGSTGGSFFDSGLWITQSFLNTLFEADTMIPFGDLVVGAKLVYAGRVTFHPEEERTIVDVYTLLGDPLVSFGLPERDLSLNLNPPSLNPGDTLVLSGYLGDPLTGDANVEVYYDTYYRDRLVLERDVPVSNGIFNVSIPFPDTLLSGEGRMRVYFIEGGGGRDFMGGEAYQIGDPVFLEIRTDPLVPTENDTVHIYTRIFDPDGVDSLLFRWSLHNPGNWVSISMIPLGGDTFRTLIPIPSQGHGTHVYYEILAWDSLGNLRMSKERDYRIPLRPDLRLPSPPVITLGGRDFVTLSAKVENGGETRVDSGIVEFYMDTGPGDSLLGSTFIEIPPYGEGLAEIPFSLPQDRYSIFLRLDPDSLIPEILEGNNSNEGNPVLVTVDRFNVTPASGTGGEVRSYDGNMRVIIPPQSITGNTVLAILPVGVQNFEPLHQPDLDLAPLPGLPFGGGYRLLFGDTAVGFLPGMEMTLNFFFDSSDSNLLAVYRFEEGIKRWVRLGGFLNSDHLELSTSSLGLFTLMINGDDLPPLIEVKVEGQAFANGDYVPSKPVLSALFQDLNGIDIFYNTFQVFLDENPVPPPQFTYPSKPENPNAVPLSYFPELGSGNHTVRFTGYDLNGNLGSAEIQFQVVPEFQILKAGFYPNPVRSGRAVITFTLTDRAEEAELRIYSPSGRLVRSFDRGRWGTLQDVGYHEVEWDLLDRKGGRVGNGIYFVQIRARKGEDTVTLRDKLAILR